MSFQGNEFKPGMPAYTRANEQYASSTYQKERNMNPKAILQPTSIEDIQIVIRNARDAKIPVAIRTGGHQYSGASSTTDKGILLDLKHTFRRPNIDLRVERTGGKAFLHTSVSWRLTEFFDFAKDNGIFMPTGQCAEVHLGGHVQSGGFGMLARSIGLLVDWVREISIVNYDGDVVKVTKEAEPELFYGILGGSPGNFGVVTHYKIEVQQNQNHVGSKGMWVGFHYRDNVYKQLLDILVKRANNPDLPRGYDLTINVVSRKSSIRDQFPGTDQELKDALGDTDIKNPDDLLTFKYAMIVCWVQFIKFEGEPPLDESWFDEIENMDKGTGLFKIVKKSDDPRLPQPLPMSHIAAMWLFAGAREFDLPYIKRTHTTKKFPSDKWSEWFTERVNDVLKVKDNGLWLSTQIQVYGGQHSMFIKNGLANNGTSIANRDSIISGTWDVFYQVEDPVHGLHDAKPAAEAWQKKNDEGLKQYFSETDRRLLWGSWGDWDLSKPEVWKCYYDDATFKKLQDIRKKYDPNGTFTYCPFAVPRAE